MKKIGEREGKVKWLPVASFFGFLFFVFAVGSLAGAGLGSILVAGVIWFFGTIASFFSDHFKVLSSYWTDGVLPETHFVLTALSVLTGLCFLVFIVGHFQVNIEFKRKS